MVIWSFWDDGTVWFLLLLGLLALMPLGAIVLYLKNYFLPAMRDPENRRIFPAVLLSAPLALLLVIGLCSLRLPIQMISLLTAERQTIRGQVALISCCEDWGRSLNGYNVVLNVDGQRFAPGDAFPLEVAQRLQEGGEMQFTYSVAEDGSIWTWEIEAIP